MSAATLAAPREDGAAAGQDQEKKPEPGSDPADDRNATSARAVEAAEAAKDKDDDFPEGGYGWVVVLCAFCVNSGSWGVNTTYGVYQSFYIANNYFSGGTPLRYAFVGGLSIGMALIMAPVSNYLVKRFHFRVPFIIGMVLLVISQCLAGVSKTYGALLATQGVVFGIGLGLTMIPLSPLLAHWFNARLSLAQGMANAGSGCGGLILSNTTRAAIENIGIKWALIINGMITLVLLLPAAVLAKGRVNLKARNEPLQFQFLWHKGYFFVWTWGAFAMMGYFISLYSLATYSTNGLGLSQTKGAALQSVLAAGQMIGRPIMGYFLDLGGRINSTIIIQLLAGLSCFVIWLPSRSFGVLLLFALVQGLLGGTLWSAAPPVTRSVVGVQHIASALAIFWISTAAPACLADAAAVALIDYSRNTLGRTGPDAYTISICLGGSLFIVSGIMLFGAKVYVQKSAKIFQKA